VTLNNHFNKVWREAIGTVFERFRGLETERGKSSSKKRERKSMIVARTSKVLPEMGFIGLQKGGAGGGSTNSHETVGRK